MDIFLSVELPRVPVRLKLWLEIPLQPMTQDSAAFRCYVLSWKASVENTLRLGHFAQKGGAMGCSMAPPCIKLQLSYSRFKDPLW